MRSMKGGVLARAATAAWQTVVEMYIYIYIYINIYIASSQLPAATASAPRMSARARYESLLLI